MSTGVIAPVFFAGAAIDHVVDVFAARQCVGKCFNAARAAGNRFPDDAEAEMFIQQQLQFEMDEYHFIIYQDTYEWITKQFCDMARACPEHESWQRAVDAAIVEGEQAYAAYVEYHGGFDDPAEQEMV
jgi:hypothetical protein